MARAQPDPLVGKILAERFEVLERIGEGGTGVVYKAKQLSVDRMIAIKVLGAHVSTDPNWVKRFHNEARAASKLDHPNTVRLFDFGQTREGLLFIAMELLQGRSLRQEIDRTRRIPPARVMRIIMQACGSLQEAHQKGIIHRDIKPDNIYLLDNATGDLVKVLDFSVAKLSMTDGAGLTRAGVVFGTPAYMSPEQGRGLVLDARSDIYALGIVAYEMLSGRPPFDAKLPTDVVMMHLQQKPPPLADVQAAAAQLVMKALEKDPRHRQQSASELSAECEAVLESLSNRDVAPVVAGPAQGQSTVMMNNPPPRGQTALPQAKPQRPSGPEMRAGPDQRTIGVGMPSPESNPQRTIAIPDSQGVVAFAAAEAERARLAAQPEILRAPPAGVLFWFAWVIFGVAAGIALHLFVLHPMGR